MDEFEIMGETIKIKYHADIDEIGYVGGKLHSNWIDLRAGESVEMKAGDYKLISLGVSIELPEGYEAIVAPRSSTYAKYGIILAASIGVIDEAYRGDDDVWYFPAIALRDTYIPINDRICQFRIFKHQPDLEFDRVFTLGNPNRKGVGSTGTR